MAKDEKPDKVVEIKLDERGMPVPDQDPVQVWRKNQKVRWTADFDFRISIDGYDQVAYSKGGKHHTCKTGYFGDGVKSYKYTISANGVDNDPTLELLP